MTSTTHTVDARQFDEVDATGQAAGFIALLDRQRERMEERGTNLAAALPVQIGDHVLDVGCGPGIWSFDIEDRVGPSGRVVGLDFSADMVAEARARAAERRSQVAFDVGDVRRLALRDAAFDVVSCSMLLLHVDAVEDAVREMVRVTKPGGWVCAVEPDHHMTTADGSDQARAEKVMRGHFSRLRTPRIGRRLHRLFVEAGLDDVRVEVKPVVSTDWASFVARMPVERILASAESSVTTEEIRDVYSDFERRGQTGTFFSCLIVMHAVGRKPST